jgi:hypothetical protein
MRILFTILNNQFSFALLRGGGGGAYTAKRNTGAHTLWAIFQ